jgi:membrane protein YqaA with SNARE-associated domain
MGFVDQAIEWTNRTFGALGSFGLFLVAFMESSFFPVPPDLLLIALALAEPDKALWFALIATIGSVLGGMFGYLIGYIGEHAVLSKMFSKAKIEKVHRLFNKYEFGAIFFAGFTPIPYKVFTISAGVFYINFKKFVLASFLSRGSRFFAEAIIVILIGQKMLDFFDKNFNLITIVVGILVIVGIYIYKKLKRT